MTLAERYHKTVIEQLRRIADTQMPAIERAGEVWSTCLLERKWIYVFGAGHSHLMAEELFYRAGGLARIRPILVPDLLLDRSAAASSDAEREAGRVDSLLSDYPMVAGDALLIASNSGRNAVPVELAIRARRLGVETMAIVNGAHAAAFASRHPSGKLLADVVDLLIDNSGVAGDACVPLPDGSCSIGATSTVTGACIVQMVASHAVEKALDRGWAPEIFASANTDRGDEINRALLLELRGLVRHL